MKLKSILLKIGMVAGAVGGFAGYLSDQGILAMLPPKYAATIGVVSGAAGMVAAWLHAAPGQPAPPAEIGK